jgi:hypothetical protein
VHQLAMDVEIAAAPDVDSQTLNLS